MRNKFVLTGAALFVLFSYSPSHAASCGGWFQSPCPKASLTIGNKPAPKTTKQPVVAAKPQVQKNANGKPLVDPNINSGNGIVAQGGGNLISPGNRNGIVAQGGGNIISPGNRN